VIADGGRGVVRSGYELVLGHYVGRLGMAAPWSARYAAKLRPEGGGGHASSFDQLGFGTLTHTRDPQVAQPRPSGLTAWRSGSAVILSWWGVAGATAYRLQRAPAAGGPTTTVAEVTDPLTHTDRDVAPGEHVYTVVALRDGVATTTSEPLRVSTVTRQRPLDWRGQLRGGARLVAGRAGQAVALDDFRLYDGALSAAEVAAVAVASASRR
jgi:hypothetical protein